MYLDGKEGAFTETSSRRRRVIDTFSSCHHKISNSRHQNDKSEASLHTQIDSYDLE